MAALLHANADGVQAEQGVGQVGRPLPCLSLGKLQNGQRLTQRLQPVSPADPIAKLDVFLNPHHILSKLSAGMTKQHEYINC